MNNFAGRLTIPTPPITFDLCIFDFFFVTHFCIRFTNQLEQLAYAFSRSEVGNENLKNNKSAPCFDVRA